MCLVCQRPCPFRLRMNLPALSPGPAVRCSTRAAIVQTCAAALAVGDLLTARYGEAWMTRPTTFRKEEQ